MLDDLIRSRSGASRLGARLRIARGVQAVARVMVVPALALMLLGLLAHLGATSPGQIPGEPVLPVRRLFGRALLSSVGAMSLGLLLIALIPAVSVILVLVERVRSRQWEDAAVALGVLAILLVSMLLVRA